MCRRTYETPLKVATNNKWFNIMTISNNDYIMLSAIRFTEMHSKVFLLVDQPLEELVYFLTLNPMNLNHDYR